MLARLWLTGYRAWEVNAYGDQDPKITVIKYTLKNALRPLIEDGLEWVITGGELGVEQWGAAAALELKAAYPQLQVAMMLPFGDFGHQWNEANQTKLQTLTAQVDFSQATSSGPYESPAQLSGYTRFMAQHTDGALMLYDLDFEGKPKFAYQAALAEQARREYPLTLITMPDLEESARDYAENQANEHFQSD